jgi:hypothetical protein
VPSKQQAEAFFRECNDWQRPIFLALAVYGMRVGELTHLLIEDVDVKEDVIWIRSKPELLWFVKTSRERVLPIFPEVKPLIQRLIGSRKAGFVFLGREFAEGKSEPPMIFASPQAMRGHVLQLADQARLFGRINDSPAMTLFLDKASLSKKAEVMAERAVFLAKPLTQGVCALRPAGKHLQNAQSHGFRKERETLGPSKQFG